MMTKCINDFCSNEFESDDPCDFVCEECRNKPEIDWQQRAIAAERQRDEQIRDKHRILQEYKASTERLEAARAAEEAAKEAAEQTVGQLQERIKLLEERIKDWEAS